MGGQQNGFLMHYNIIYYYYCHFIYHPFKAVLSVQLPQTGLGWVWRAILHICVPQVSVEKADLNDFLENIE